MADLDARVRAILDEDEDDDLVDYGDSPLPSPAKPPAAVAEAPVDVVPARSAVVDVEAARAMMEQARRDRDAETLRMAAENLPDDDDDDEDLWDDDDDDGGEDQQAAMAEEDLDELLASDPTPPAPLPIPLAPQPQLGEKRSRDRVDDDVDMMDVEATIDDDENAAPPGPSTMNNTAGGDDDDEEMRDQHTFVPLEESEVVLAEHICRKVREHKKHLVRLLIKQFGSALCEGALKETMRIEREGGSFVTLDGAGGTRRRLPGGVFIMTMKQRAPAVDFKAVMKRSGEIDKALKKQLEARGPAPPRKRTKVDHQSLGGGGGGGRGRGGGRGGRGGRERGRRGGRGGRCRGGREGGREGGRGGGRTGGATVTTYAVDI